MSEYTAMNNQKNPSQKYDGISPLGRTESMNDALQLIKHNNQSVSPSVIKAKEDSATTPEGGIADM